MVCARRCLCTAHACLASDALENTSISTPICAQRFYALLFKRRRQQRYSRRAEGQGKIVLLDAAIACGGSGRITQRQKEGTERWRRQWWEEEEGKLITLNTVIQSFVKALSACKAFASDAARTRTQKARNTVSWEQLQNTLFTETYPSMDVIRTPQHVHRVVQGTSLGPSGYAFASKAGGPGIEPTVRLSLSPSRSSRVDAGAILVGVSISHPY